VSNWSLELKESRGSQQSQTAEKRQNDGLEMHQTEMSHLGVKMVQVEAMARSVGQ
jgi:hypothetical protein